MLKIKDNVDLKELEKSPFFFEDGETYVEGFYLLEDDDATIYVNKETRELIITLHDGDATYGYENYCVEIVFDLIQAGLVEKVVEKVMDECRWCGKEFDPYERSYSSCCSDFCQYCWFAEKNQITNDKVACPYCNSEFYVKYEYYHNAAAKEFECKSCGRTFLLTGESSIKYTSEPIREEIEIMIKEILEEKL